MLTLSWPSALLTGIVSTASSSSSMVNQSGPVMRDLRGFIGLQGVVSRKFFLRFLPGGELLSGRKDQRIYYLPSPRVLRTTSTARPSLYFKSPSEMNRENEARLVCLLNRLFIFRPLRFIKSIKSLPLSQLQSSLVEPSPGTQPRSLATQMTCPLTRSSAYCRFALLLRLTQPYENRRQVFNTFVGVCEAVRRSSVCRW